MKLIIVLNNEDLSTVKSIFTRKGYANDQIISQEEAYSRNILPKINNVNEIYFEIDISHDTSTVFEFEKIRDLFYHAYHHENKLKGAKLRRDDFYLVPYFPELEHDLDLHRFSTEMKAFYIHQIMLEHYSINLLKIIISILMKYDAVGKKQNGYKIVEEVSLLLWQQIGVKVEEQYIQTLCNLIVVDIDKSFQIIK